MSNTERFTGRADTYRQYRQRYPAEDILADLRTWNVLTPQARVADVGAGTGMLTEVFLSAGNTVIAIEPNAEMRAGCEPLLASFSKLTILEATAEVTTLPNASVDIVAAGRAFHWFDIPRALAEFRRILTPGGSIVLVSLGRSKEDTPQSDSFEHLLTTHGTDYTNYVRSGYRIHENLHEFFPIAFRQAQLPGEEQLDWPSFRGQTLSLSVAPQPNNPHFPTFEAALRNHFDQFATNGVITIPTTCWITAGQLSTQ
jgi:ubiquinone/menaquinone biosynthesis C-methylase UbiE